MKNNRMSRLLAIATVLFAGAMGAMAQSAPDVDSIATAAGTTFTAVATLCVTIGTFYVGYRLVKRIK